ncbi:MAG: SIMPL domain-containing protein [Clostridia bacterium]|nr:SIMPL domain-containing protein [Clostridia bacterium]
MDIMVEGVGRRFYKPNQVVLSINFLVNDATYEKALEKGVKSVEDFIVLVLQKLDIAKEELKTRSFRISQNTRYDYETKKTIFNGYDYTQGATLKLDYNMETISEFMSLVSSLAEPPRYTMTFSIKDMEGAKKEVLAEAYNKAKEKAETIAAAAGKQLKDCIKTDFRPFAETVTSHSRLSDMDMLEETGVMYKASKARSTAETIQTVFTPEDVEISETLYCLWIAE